MLNLLPSLSLITNKPAAPPNCATFALAVKVQSPRLAKATELVNCSNKSFIENLSETKQQKYI